MAVELALGKTPVAAGRIEQSDILEALDGLPPAGEHCALLASDTLKEALKSIVAMHEAKH
jgi:NifU-like protein involved in Fe-S cluster formation